LVTASSSNLPLRFGVFEHDLKTGELRKSGRAVRLRPQAAKVLGILASRAGQLVTREDLQGQLWGEETFVDFEHSINLCIREIRTALSDDASTPRYVETLPRQGYRFIAPIHDRDHSVKDPAGDLPRSAPANGTTPAIMAPRRSFYWPLALFGAVVVLAIAIVAAVTNPGDWRGSWFAGATKPVHAIAVLPLQNLTGDSAQDYFADGMTEALTTDLARMESLQVISRTSTMQYKTVKKSLPVIARELNADAVVEGSVQRAGHRIRVTAQLVRAADDRHLWAETYERDFRDILALQDDVASAIAKQIESRLGGPQPQPLAKAPAISPEAYETYLKANYYLDQLDLQKSIEYYNQAIKLDPNFAPAYAHMARAYFFLAFFGAVSPKEGWSKVKEAAELAVEKDEHLPEGHGALGLAKLHYDWDFVGAEREFERGLELNPNNADIHHDFAHYLMAMGRVAESEAESKRALALDPMGDVLNSCLCWHSFAARDYDQSVRLAQKFLTSQPDDPWELTILGWDYEQKGMPEQAVAKFRKAVEVTKDTSFNSFFLAALGHGYALAGSRPEAGKVLQTLSDRGKKSYVSSFDLAMIHAGLGEKDEAFTLLEKSIGERSTFLVDTKWEPRLDPLRSDPRFIPILKQIGLPVT
jgi:TolB-like protein/DNA-binding winged helix-turn-helix (wHTH) protein/Tfp pilus assembly protein PilF